MSGLPPTLNPTLAGGVLTLAGRQIQGQYSWAARPTDKFTVDSVDTTLHVAYCRRAGDLVPNNEYPFPYPSNLTLHPGDNVIVEWDPSGPFIVGGGSTGAGNGEVIQHNGLDVGEEPGLNFRDSNPVAFNIVDDTADHRVNLVAAAPLPSEVHLRPGDAFEFLPTAPPELPPIAEALGTGTGPGGLPYYALLYTTAGNPTELGPISFPVDGTTAVAVAIPNIPAENDKATGQILYRSDDFGQTWGAIHGYADLVSHVFTDTGVALGAAPATFATIAQVQRAYSDLIRGVGTSNTSDLGMGGVTGKGLKVGNHDRVDYLPDPTTIQMLPCAAPRVAPSVSVSVGAGPGAGERQYAILYHTAAGDSVKGPASAWIDGTLATGVALAAVPTLPTGVWTDVTGQALLRTKAGGGPFWVVHDYPGSLTLQGFIDTVPDSSLVTGYSEQAVTVKSLGGGDVEHNDVNVATEPTLDFEDSATVTFAVTDDPTNTRVKVSATAVGGGGGGGGGAGTGAAVYTFASDFRHLNTSTQYYIPWDTIFTGDDVYLDPAHTDGLTIPAGAGGDYWFETVLHPTWGLNTGDDWLVEYDLTIELWRSGAQVWVLDEQDEIGHLFGDRVAAWTDTPISISSAVPATEAGDVIKVGLYFTITDIGAFSGGTTINSGVPGHTPPFASTWASIAPVGKTTTVSVPSNAALYGLSTDFDSITAAGAINYIPWDTILLGDNAYLDIAHTDGLTIPAGSDGDYTLDMRIWFETAAFASTQWSVQYTLAIEVWRGGSNLVSLYNQDLYQHPLDRDGFPILDENDELSFGISSVLPALLAGDVVKTYWSYYNGGSLASGPHTPDPGAQYIYSGPWTYIGITRVG